MSTSSGVITVNHKLLDDYLSLEVQRMDIRAPFKITNTLCAFDININVYDGGFTGQATAIRHSIARALNETSEDHRLALKKNMVLKLLIVLLNSLRDNWNDKLIQK